MSLDFGILLQVWPFLLRGAWMTVQLTLAVLLVSAPFALLVALARNSQIGWLSTVVAVLSWMFRGVPPLLVLFLVFFSLPQFGLQIQPVPAAIVGMTLYMSFYFGESVRAGLASVGKGQYDAARSLGLPAFHTLRRVVLPQALRAILPPYMSHATEVVKGTSLTASIAVAELTGNAYQLIVSTLRPLEILVGIALVYAVLDSAVLFFQAYAERRWAAR